MPEPTQRIEGVRAVLEALRAGRRRVHEVMLPDEVRTPGLRELQALARELGIPTRRAPDASGVAARAAPFPERAVEDLLVRGAKRFWVALDRVTDVGNLGSIARSAEAAGAEALVLEQRHAPPIQAGALRASAGALEHLEVARAPNLRRALELARGEGFAILAADLGAPPLADLPPAALTGDLVWVFGSEDRGLRESVLAVATHRVGIPLHGRVGSLGVAAAAAFLLHRTAELRSSG